MRSRFFKQFSILSISAAALVLPSVTAHAQVADDVAFNNPLGVNSIQDLLVNLLEVVIIIAVPIIVFFVIYAGFMYVTAQGNATKIQNASRALTYALIGGVLIIGATAIAQIVRNLVDAF